METIPIFVTKCERDVPVKPSVVSTLLVSQRDSLERVWDYPLVQCMIANCTGLENPLDEFRIMRAGQERRTGMSRFANDISRRLIHIAANQLNVSEEDLTSGQAINALFEIVAAKFHFVFALPIRGAREREYSMYHRFACTLYQVTDVHNHLVSLGATANMETLRIAMVIVFKSKHKLINSDEAPADYGLALNAVGLWNFDTQHYGASFFTRIPDLRVANIEDQIELLKLFSNLPPEAIQVLRTLVLTGTSLNYYDFFCLYMGINEEERRYSFVDMRRTHGGTTITYPDRWSSLITYLLTESRYRSAGFQTLSRGTHLLEARFKESQRYADAIKATSKLRELSALASRGRIRAHFAFTCEFYFYVRTFHNYRNALYRLIASGRQALIQCYREVSTLEYEYQKGLSKRIGSFFPEPVLLAFPFTEVHFGCIQTNNFSSVQNLIKVTLGTSESQHYTKMRLGLATRDKLVAAELLRYPFLLERRLGQFFDEVVRCMRNHDRYDFYEIAETLGCTPNTLSSIITYVTIDAVCSGISDPHRKRQIAAALRTTESKLDSLCVSLDDPEYLTKVQAVIDLVSRQFIHIRGKGVLHPSLRCSLDGW